MSNCRSIAMADFVDVQNCDADEQLLASVAAALGVGSVAELRSMQPSDVRRAVARQQRSGPRTWAAAWRALAASVAWQAFRSTLPGAVQLLLATLALRVPARLVFGTSM